MAASNPRRPTSWREKDIRNAARVYHGNLLAFRRGDISADELRGVDALPARVLRRPDGLGAGEGDGAGAAWLAARREMLRAPRSGGPRMPLMNQSPWKRKDPAMIVSERSRPVTPPRELLTTWEVAEVLGVTPRRVRQLVERGTPGFPAPYAVTRARGQQLWRPEDIERWAASADRSAGRRRKT